MLRPLYLPETCSFSDYFKLNAYPEEILNHFGYQFELKELELPQKENLSINIEELKQNLRQALPFIPMDNETARREFLIAPVLMKLAIATETKVRVNHTIEVSPQLRGSIDYFLESKHQLLVIEAKDENLERGFKQLAVELIAIAHQTQAENHSVRRLWGAVSIGRFWQFSLLDFQKNVIIQDINLYQVPHDLDYLLRGLVGILSIP